MPCGAQTVSTQWLNQLRMSGLSWRVLASLIGAQRPVAGLQYRGRSLLTVSLAWDRWFRLRLYIFFVDVSATLSGAGRLLSVNAKLLRAALLLGWFSWALLRIRAVGQ